MILNGNNQAKCPYCLRFCKKIQGVCLGFGKHAKWQECPECKTKFAVGPKATLRGARYKVSDPREPDNYYIMEINYKSKTTWIYHYSRPDYKLSTNCDLGPGQYTVTGSSGSTYNFGVSVGGRIRWAHSEKSILRLDKAVRDITPSNVFDKIKMYILFS